MLKNIIKKLKNVLFCGDDDIFVISLLNRSLILA